MNDYTKINVHDIVNEYAKAKGLTNRAADQELYNYGFLDKTITVKGNTTTTLYEFSTKGKEIIQSGKSFDQYLKELQQYEIDKIKRENEQFKRERTNLLLTVVNVLIAACSAYFAYVSNNDKETDTLIQQVKTLQLTVTEINAKTDSLAGRNLQLEQNLKRYENKDK